MWFVYRITCQINGKSYVGKAKNPKTRWTAHKRGAKKGNKCHFSNAIRFYGVDSFVLSIEKEFELEHEAYAYETNLIEHEDLLKNGYNSSPGMIVRVDLDQVRILRAESVRESWSDSRRSLMSEQHSGDKNPFYGKHHDVETIERLRLAGREQSLEQRKNHSVRMTGRSHTMETKSKISESQPTKNKTLEEAFGYERASEIRKNLSENQPDRKGSKHPRTNLSDDDVFEIRQSGPNKKHVNVLVAEKFNISPRAVYKIKARETWKHLP